MVSVFSSKNVEISSDIIFLNIARMLWFYFMVLLFWGFSWTNNFLGKIHGWREHLTMSFVHIPYSYRDNLKCSTTPTKAKSKTKYGRFYFATIFDKWHGRSGYCKIEWLVHWCFLKRFKQNRMINLQIFLSYSEEKKQWEMQIMIWFIDVFKRSSNKIG